MLGPERPKGEGINESISRRCFFENIGGGLASLMLWPSLKAQDGPGRTGPNIFLAIADDWGWPHASIYGDKIVKTPTFDRIAQRGILFTHAFVSAPSCTPSRGALLTGEHFWRLGPGANLWSSLPEAHPTYPNILQDHGYLVGSFRKAWGPGKHRAKREGGPVFKSFQDFLNQRPGNKPFCFWFGSSDPHRGYKWQSGIQSGMHLEGVVVPPCFPDTPEIRTDICDYYFEVQRFDHEVGKQLELLEKAGELDHTLVIMTSDHGWPFPRGKSNLYDLGTRVPLAMQWGSKIRERLVVDDFVSLTDMAPTLLEASGLEPLPTMTGRSLMNLLESHESGRLDPSRDHVLFGRERHTPAQPDHMGGYPMRAIRNRDFLYIHNFKPERWPAGGETSLRGPAFSDIDDSPTKRYIVEHRHDPKVRPFLELSCGKRPSDELYDMTQDPYQLNNVASDPEYQQVLKSLKTKLMKELERTQDPRVLGKGDNFDQYSYYGKMEKKP